MPAAPVDLELAEAFGTYSLDPLEFAYFAYPWGSGELEDVHGPRKWQAGILNLISDHLQSDKRHTPLRIAVSSGHGIGKSALIAMITGWAMSCYEDARVNVTANTGGQLDTKTWPEISLWFRRLINAHWFRVKGESISSVEKDHEETWRADAITWSENNPAAFAGLHNKGKIVVLIMDESSEIADVVWETSEGATTDEDTVIIWLAFGNPTQNSGRFAECFGRFKHRWKTYHIDSRTVEGTNKKQAEEWVRDYGEDSDFVRVRVRGEFPRAGSTQFISSDLVQGARARTLKPEEYEGHWKILVCDVARYGDDQTVIGIRQGPKFTIIDKCRFDPIVIGPQGQKMNSTVQTANRVMAKMKEHNPRTVVIDGDGIGGGVVDYIRESTFGIAWSKENPARRIMEFHGGSAPNDANMYFNFRASMWGAIKTWLQTGDIPDDPELASDLTGPQYFFSNKNQIQLEKKEDMKKRGLASPDLGDTLAMSFCAFTASKTREEIDTEKVEAAPPGQQRELLRYKLTMDRNSSLVRAEERRPAHWD